MKLVEAVLGQAAAKEQDPVNLAGPNQLVVVALAPGIGTRFRVTLVAARKLPAALERAA